MRLIWFSLGVLTTLLALAVWSAAQSHAADRRRAHRLKKIDDAKEWFGRIGKL